MSPDREYFDYVRDMLGNSQKAIEFVAGMSYQQFLEETRPLHGR
jgi:hypothetical protein